MRKECVLSLASPSPLIFMKLEIFKKKISGMELHEDRGEGPRRRRVGALRKPSADERRMFRLESGRRTN